MIFILVWIGLGIVAAALAVLERSGRMEPVSGGTANSPTANSKCVFSIYYLPEAPGKDAIGELKMTHTEIVNSIKTKLCEIEKKENIKIIYACESGSRAWGFASPDSDYDVRFIYIRPVKFYLKLENTRDTLECELNEVYDITGWDLKKFLWLLNKSNPSIFEWAQSPIVYKHTKEWSEILKIIDNYYSKSKALYHYNSITKNNLGRYFDGKEEVKYKPYLYNLRQCLACEWIMNRQTPPPIEFSVLAENYLPETLESSVDKLIELKKSVSEKDKGNHIAEIDEYIESVVAKVDKFLETPEEKHKSDWNELNRVFLRLVQLQVE